jgi:hypothetical protein
LIDSLNGLVLTIDDPKEGKQTLNLGILQQFVGKEISISISNIEE